MVTLPHQRRHLEDPWETGGLCLLMEESLSVRTLIDASIRNRWLLLYFFNALAAKPHVGTRGYLIHLQPGIGTPERLTFLHDTPPLLSGLALGLALIASARKFVAH